MSKKASQSDVANMWNAMIPPPDGQIIINRLGTVCMSYNTLKQLGYECTADGRMADRGIVANGKEEK